MFIFRNKRVESISPETTFVKAKQEETLGGVLERKRGKPFLICPLDTALSKMHLLGGI